MRPRDVVASLCGIAAVAVAVLAVGSAPRWSQAIVAVMVAVAMIPYVTSSQGQRFSPLVLVPLVCIGVTALQLVPLPHGVLETFNPVGASLRAEGAELLGTSPWPSISMDAPGSLRAIAMLTALAGIASVAVRIAVSERGRYVLLSGVAGLGGLVAVIVGIHEVFAARELYGIYAPAYARPAVLGPLLNENHLGCFMALSATVALGLVLYRRQRASVRVMWLVIVGLCAATTVATISRGATIALGTGLACTLAIVFAQRAIPSEGRTRRRSFRITSLPIAIVGVCAIVIVVYGSTGGISRELSRTGLSEIAQPKSKYAAWRSSVTLIEEAPIFGQGRGAFETVFSRVHPSSGLATFTHLENELLQVVVDWGTVGVIAIGGAMLWLFVVVIRRWRGTSLAAGALGGLAAVALQSNVDFGLEILGVAAPTVIVAATLAYGQPRSLTRPRSARAARIAQVLVVLAMCPLLLSAFTASVAEDRVELAQKSAPTLDEIREAATRHPHDYYLFALASRVVRRESTALSVGLLNHALRLHPTHAGLHVDAARMLFAGGRITQATIEYASALRASASPERVIRELLPRFSRENVAATIPLDISPARIVKILEDERRDDIAVVWLERFLRDRPNSLSACELLFDVALRRGDLVAAASVHKYCGDFEPGPQGRLQLAYVLFRKNGFEEVDRLLSDVELWTGRIDMKMKAWLLRCDAYLSTERWDIAKRCLRRLDASGLVGAENRSQITSRLDRADTLREADAPP
jgi:O-antigen ligase